jgi:hypothetical protein
MADSDLVQRYNYDEFVPEKFEPWLNFEAGPALGQPAPSFPLWRLDDGAETSLQAIWAEHMYTIVELGSFT